MQRFYFDHNATSPVSPEVMDAMLPCLAEVYGNASSIHHFGQSAKQRLEGARRQVAALVGADPREIVFTSGGTESDNLAILGTVRPCAGKHVVTTTIEHPAVLNTCAQVAREGGAVTYVPVGPSGVVDADDIRRAIRPETALISVMHANNELGTLQPVEQIAGLGVPVHSDGVQTAGRVRVRMDELGVDLFSLSGHKFGAPKGIGALYVRRGTSLSAISYGGHHERDRRPGTENVAGAVALGRAAEIAPLADVSALRDRLENGILERVPSARVNGDRRRRLPNTTNIRFEWIEGEAMVIALDLRGFAVSSGAACSSGAVEPSHVLTAIGLSREEARSSLRFSLGPGNTVEQVDALIEAVEECAAHLRKVSATAPSHV